jgi:hypothetical protein
MTARQPARKPPRICPWLQLLLVIFHDLINPEAVFYGTLATTPMACAGSRPKVRRVLPMDQEERLDPETVQYPIVINT